MHHHFSFQLCRDVAHNGRPVKAGFSKITPANLQAPKTPWSVFQDGQGAALIPHQAPHCRAVRMPQSTPGSIRGATQMRSSHHQCGATPTQPAAPEPCLGTDDWHARRHTRFWHDVAIPQGEDSTRLLCSSIICSDTWWAATTPSESPHSPDRPTRLGEAA